ncbi:RidA family protein [Ignatzschineria sp. LJL83]
MIQRINPGARMSDAVIYQNTVYYTAIPTNIENDIYLQMQSTLADIDQMLKSVGTDKSKILDVTIFLVSSLDLEGMNRAWDEWVDSENAPVRCTVQAGLMSSDWKVEIKVVAGR